MILPFLIINLTLALLFRAQSRRAGWTYVIVALAIGAVAVFIGLVGNFPLFGNPFLFGGMSMIIGALVAATALGLLTFIIFCIKQLRRSN